jgi:lambda repressor-like predicted transcriptional regulator
MREDGCSKAEMKRQTGLAYNTIRKCLERIDE